MREVHYPGYRRLYNKLSESTLSSTERAIVLAIYWLTHTDIKATRQNLSKYVGLSLRSTSCNLANLTNSGIIMKALHKGEDGGNLATTYSISDDAILAAITKENADGL